MGSYHRDLNSSKSVESVLALQYESCCWAIQIIAKRQIETDLNQINNYDNTKFDASIGFDFVLKGLGGSQSSLDANQIFSQGIFGYRKPYFLNN